MVQPKNANQQIQDIVIYKSDEGQLSFNVNVFEETVWLTQEEISLLFGKAKSKRSLTEFFKELGDRNSDINKVIKGAKITKNVMAELIRLGNKPKDLF